MPRNKISEYSTTNSDNTDISSINIAEGCAPSGINNAIREVMVHLKNWQTNASGDGATFASLVVQGTGSFTGAVTMSAGATLSGTNTLSGSTVMAASAGTSASPSIYFFGDTNTGIFSPAADTIAFTEGGVEAMRIDSSGNVGIGTTSPSYALDVRSTAVPLIRISRSGTAGQIASMVFEDGNAALGSGSTTRIASDSGAMSFSTGGTSGAVTGGTERMRIDSSGNVIVGGTSAINSASGRGNITINGSSNAILNWGVGGAQQGYIYHDGTNMLINNAKNGIMQFYTNDTERARITSAGDFMVARTNTSLGNAGFLAHSEGYVAIERSAANVLYVNRLTNDGALVGFYQATTLEGEISVSGNTVTYGSFSGGHWSQLQQGRGYNPEILRGTVMSSIGEMAEWKSVVWDEVIEHPAVPAVEAKEAVLDEEGNVIEPAVEEVEGKDAWTETNQRRENYLGNLPIGATFDEDGVTKTVVDDGNERLPKVKISDAVGDKAVYGVFQTWDEAQDMMVVGLGAFVVRIAAGVTVQIGDLLESNGDGCAKVQDDDVIRSKTIGKVTSTTPTATYADGSYTVPAVLYCG